MSNFTRSAILKTFDDMLESMPFEKITVSALIKTCNVSRNTFYYHFSDMDSFLKEYLHHLQSAPAALCNSFFGILKTCFPS